MVLNTLSEKKEKIEIGDHEAHFDWYHMFCVYIYAVCMYGYLSTVNAIEVDIGYNDTPAKLNFS